MTSQCLLYTVLVHRQTRNNINYTVFKPTRVTDQKKKKWKNKKKLLNCLFLGISKPFWCLLSVHVSDDMQSILYTVATTVIRMMVKYYYGFSSYIILYLLFFVSFLLTG